MPSRDVTNREASAICSRGVSRRYTLEAALVARRAHTDAETERLAGEKRRVATAAAEVARIVAELEAFDAARRRAEVLERQHLENGEGRVFDLYNAAATDRALSLAREHLCAELEEARAALTRSKAAEARAQQLLATAFTEQRAVERHREGWERARAVEAELALDEQAQETWQPARFDSFRR